MAIPKIKINYLNGQLGTVPESQDGLLALVVGATAVSSSFLLNTPYTIYRSAGLSDLGIIPENNARLYELVTQFYAETDEGTPLVIVGTDPGKKMTELCDKASGPLATVIQTMKGELRGLILARNPEEEEVEATEGLDPDVFTALPKAQELAEWATITLYAPLFVALEGRHFTGAASLKDLSEENYNRCCILIGDVTSGSKGAAMGTFAGRVAAAPVQRNIGRVRDGALAPVAMYLGTKKVEDATDDITSIYGKGYITPRTYVGKAGYFYTDDRLCCEETDDYAHLTGRRTIDKAYRIAYATLLDYMLDEIAVNMDGTMQTGILKSWQATVEDAINTQMTAAGELSAGMEAGGSGAQCYIDPSQNVVATSQVELTLKVRPFGYAREIIVNLGFLVEAA